MIKISTSILSIKDNILEKVKILNSTDTDFIHYDIMDGKFVSNTSFSFDEIKEINRYVTKPLDVHLMVENPTNYIEYYKNLNPYYITIHYEINNYIKYVEYIKSLNIKVGLSIKPQTKVEDIFYILDKLDLVLIMSVEPGIGGQKFVDSTIDKIEKLNKYIKDNKLKTLIEVDGGINNITSKKCIKAGANILVSGTYITNSNNYQKQIDELKK